MRPGMKYRGTHNEFPLRDDMAMTGTASTTECTGLVPEGNIDSAEEFDDRNRLNKFSEGKSKR